MIELEPAPTAVTKVALVVGLDLSMTGTGIAWWDGTTTTLHPKTKGDDRLVEITDHLMAIVADLVVIEDLPLSARSAGITGMVHGAVRAMLKRCGIPYATVPPATLKKYATGRGNADKPAMAVAAYKRLGLEGVDDNRVDAAWLRAAGLDYLGQPLCALPASQRAALDKVDWPPECSVPAAETPTPAAGAAGGQP